MKLRKIGGTKVFGQKIKYLRTVFAAWVISCGCVCAQDITAIDFEGNVIGKVIPDGTAINLKNEIMGQMTADSFIISPKGDILGGIVPQGFVIGNDYKYLGKVASDGTVRLPSGRIGGKVLPSGLVIDEASNVIGSVLSGGVVYNDDGKAVGRVAGNGAYVNFEGKTLGFVSSNGYAYRRIGTNYALDGRLISSKTVVDKEGKFIGSILPGGRAVNFDGVTIGQIHGNGYVYNASGKIVGAAVRSAYAFNNDGTYIGFVSYNGEVIKEGKNVGRIRSDYRIVDEQGQVIGFSVDLNAVAVDEQGKYLGYLADGGRFVKDTNKAAGFVGTKRTVVDNQGNIIGQIANVGPIFNYLGDLKAEAAVNGQVVSFEGEGLGYMKADLAFDNAGFLIGKAMDTALIIDAKQNILGISGVNSAFSYNGAKYRVSPFGYLLNSDDVVIGSLRDFAPTYDESGVLFSYIGMDGGIDIPTGTSLKLQSNGYVTDQKTGEIKAFQINPKYAVSLDTDKSYRLSETNILYAKDGKASAKVVPEYDIVGNTDEKALMPLVGFAGKYLGVVLSVKGEVVGYVNPQGRVFYQNTSAGQIKQDTMAYNSQGVFIGENMPFGVIVNNACENIGVVGLKGEARNARDAVLGKVLINNRVISQTGQNIGHIAHQGAVYDFDGALIGFVNPFGRILNAQAEQIGCLDRNGRLYEDNGVYKGGVATPAPVMSFKNKIIGRTNLKNRFIDVKGEDKGFVLPDGTVKNDKDDIEGLLFLYRFAFDKENNFVGRVAQNGQVFDDKGNLFGVVTYDGLITSGNKAVGYALYDLYIYDGASNVIGYLTKNGSVVDFTGMVLGKADRGFLLSKDGALIGRGKRDYIVRNKSNVAVGELMLSGEMIDFEGRTVGQVSNSGEVRDSSARLVGTAKPLQFYIYNKKNIDWNEKSQGEIKVEPVNVPQSDEPVPSYAKKVIGVVLSPDGKYLGDLLEDGTVVDKSGNLIGYGKDGLVFDENENLIGVVETEKQPAAGQVSSQIYLPPEAYGTSNKPSNLGPGGGFGPNERYDPVRARLLAEAQNIRQGGIKVGKLTSNVNPSSFTGYQANWENANYVVSSWRVDMSEMILADKPIPAVLARTIMESGVAGNVPVTAIVERNVYAEDGRNIVIPAGSRVMGQASGGSTGGTTGGAVRTDITWTRLIRPDGSAFEFAQAQTGDAQGRGGALGYLDEQLLKKYTLPMVTSLMSDSLAYVMARGQTTTSSDGTTTQDARAQAANDAREHFLDNMDQIFQDLLAAKTNIQAVTYVPAGTRLIIYPKVDMWIRTAEREKEESFATSISRKPQVLIDDSNPMASIHGSGPSAGEARSATRTNNGNTKVVYDGNDGNIQPSSAPLIDDSQYEQKRRTPSSVGMTPPPSTTATAPASNQSSDTSSGQLF